MPGPISVLVVDDDQGVADLVARLLDRESSRFEVVSVTSPGEALDRIATDPPDCVVSDYEMPEMDGLDLLDAIRERLPGVPFVLYTGRDSGSVAREAIERGVSHYLQKERGTAHFAVLANEVIEAVEHRDAERRLDRQMEATDPAPEGICLVADDGTIEYVNDAFLDLHGYEREELLGQSWEVLHPDETVARIYNEVLPVLAGGGGWSGETTGQRRSGETFDQSETIHDLRSGGFVVFSAAGEDTPAGRTGRAAADPVERLDGGEGEGPPA